LPKISELKIPELVLLIKPQFECGIAIAKKYKGIIRDKKVHFNVINDIIISFVECNYYCINLTFSPITGGDGNIEYLAHFKLNANKEILPTKQVLQNVEKIVDEAFNTLLLH